MHIPDFCCGLLCIFQSKLSQSAICLFNEIIIFVLAFFNVIKTFCATNVLVIYKDTNQSQFVRKNQYDNRYYWEVLCGFGYIGKRDHYGYEFWISWTQLCEYFSKIKSKNNPSQELANLPWLNIRVFLQCNLGLQKFRWKTSKINYFGKNLENSPPCP